jgi:kinesin family protein 2/24
MGDKAEHVPFRASKLTLILRDSFVSKPNKSKVIMIACISPGSSSADHSLNTLRYADRLKDNSEMAKMLNDMYDKKNNS